MGGRGARDVWCTRDVYLWMQGGGMAELVSLLPPFYMWPFSSCGSSGGCCNRHPTRPPRHMPRTLVLHMQGTERKQAGAPFQLDQLDRIFRVLGHPSPKVRAGGC